MSTRIPLPALPHLLTGRRGAWVTLLLAVLVSVGLVGALRGAEVLNDHGSPPPGSESAQVEDLLSELPGHDVQQLAVVHTHALTMGTLLLLLLLALAAALPGLRADKLLRWGTHLLNCGLVVTVGMLAYKGTLQVIGASYADHAAIAGVSGLRAHAAHRGARPRAARNRPSGQRRRGRLQSHPERVTYARPRFAWW